jgi:hypothetical protein
MNKEIPQEKHTLFSKSIIRLALAIFVYCIGAAFWIQFYNFGELSAYQSDKAKSNLAWCTIIKAALDEGRLPWDAEVGGHRFPRFLANPEVQISPQVILLKWMPAHRYLPVQVLLLYSLGFVGCLLIMERMRLSLLPFAALLVLFNINGHVVSHLGVEHASWCGYFLLPFFALGVLDVLEDKAPHTTWIGIAITLFLIALQGSIYIFNLCIFFMVVLAFFNSHRARPLIYAIIASLLLASIRIIPALFLHTSDAHSSNLVGFTNPMQLLASLAVPDYSSSVNGGKWAGNYYVELLGLVFIFYFGVWLYIQSRHRHAKLLPALLVTALFSFKPVINALTFLKLPIYLITPTGYGFILPLLLFVIVLAVRQFQLWLEEKKPGPMLQAAFWALLFQLTCSLYHHSLFWQSFCIRGGRSDKVLPPGTATIHDNRDLIYKALLIISVLITALTLSGLLIVWRKLRNKNTTLIS